MSNNETRCNRARFVEANVASVFAALLAAHVAAGYATDRSVRRVIAGEAVELCRQMFDEAGE